MLSKTLALSIMIVLANAVGPKISAAYAQWGDTMSSRIESAINGKPSL